MEIKSRRNSVGFHLYLSPEKISGVKGECVGRGGVTGGGGGVVACAAERERGDQRREWRIARQLAGRAHLPPAEHVLQVSAARCLGGHVRWGASERPRPAGR